MQGTIKNNKKISVRKVAQIGVLSAIAYILMFISIPLPIFPSFLKIDLSDIPGIFGGMAMGPLAGFIIIAIKNFLQALTASTTFGVGEFANALIGGSYVLVICFFYKKSKTFKNVISGGILATIVMAIVGCIVDYYLVFPLYAKVAFPMEALIGLGTAINSNVTDLFSFMLWMIAPFNILKGSIMLIATLPLFKKIEKIFHE